jgi:23S rRNA-/tRNA-specific pseudouridylate synthase
MTVAFGAIPKHFDVIKDIGSCFGVRLISTPIDGKKADSEITLREVSDDASRSLVEMRIETGGKHQIRRHMAELGRPALVIASTGKATPKDWACN